MIVIAFVATLLGCNGKTVADATDRGGVGEDVSSIRVCQGASDTSCTSYEANFGMRADCTLVYSTPDVAWNTMAPAAECAALLEVVQSTALQDAMRSPGSCTTSEVAILVLRSGTTLKGAIGGCVQKPFVDMRRAMDAIIIALPRDGGVDATSP